MQKYFKEDLRAMNITAWSAAECCLAKTFASTVDSLVTALRRKNRVLICGNGGSAADAEHFAGELVGRFGYDRASLPCVSLCTPSATFTAIANDYGYDQVFKRQVQGLGSAGDVLIGISTSGNSANIVEAFKTAKEMEITTVAMTGNRDSKLSQIADITLRAPSAQTPRIQEIHGLLVHSMCRAIEEEIFPVTGRAPALPAEKIIKPDQLARLSAAIVSHQAVFTNGCFDILHPGHVYVLKEARKLGELLIVGLNRDNSVKRLKGDGRPYHRFEDRAEVLAALACVDYVVGFDEDTPKRLIEALTPKILVKGGDYNHDTIVGADWVTSHGGEVKVVPLLPGHSTTGILKNNDR
ncbi:MAG: D-glycero-beta-D-manno-heptose 1-phosphate adenylyltransferase [Candidatus Riflebacteria bacterium HGW-Riflebacteria-2]|jgi:phosphoheptose isomerase|nr:MAG: D-glycero-beta-D-manno-heptose 1-phosphate adenylyltransferase [Candidatus Riflebacteria bacterium HGW-Riflebacteria-2]